MSNILPENLNYTDNDFDSLLDRTNKLLDSVFPDVDRETANFFNILRELVCWVGDVLLQYQNNQARNARFATVDQRQHFIALTRLIGYKLSGNSPSTADLTVRLNVIPTSPFTLNGLDIANGLDGDIFTTDDDDPISFQLINSVTIPAGTNPPDVVVSVENSITNQEIFASNGAPNQIFKTSYENVIIGSQFNESSLHIIDDSNDQWTEIDGFRINERSY